MCYADGPMLILIIKHHFQRPFTACICVFEVITLVGSNQRNYFENAIVCNKLTLKTTAATQLNLRINHLITDII